jgi:predicted ArsR family transcriptional regulator
MTMPGRIESSREAILEILRHRERVGVEELAQELGLAGATVRRHLDVLMRDGYVSVSQIRGGPGRPRYAFSITEAGTELFSQHYVRLTRRLVDEVMGLSSEETAGRSGAQIASLVFEKMADRLATEHAPHVEGATIVARARRAAELLAADGFDLEVEADEAGVRMLGRGCPCRRFGAAGGPPPEACEHDRRMLERLVRAPVTVLPAEALPTEFACGYHLG